MPKREKQEFLPRYGLNYSSREISFLRSNAHLMTNKNLADSLPGRTANGIEAKLRQMNIRRRRDFVSQEEIEWLKANNGKKTYSEFWRELCRSKSTVHYLIKRFGIKCLPRPKLKQEEKNRKARERMRRLRERRRQS